MSIIIKDSDAKITRKILAGIAQNINLRLHRKAATIERNIVKAFTDTLINSPTWISIVSGKLRSEFGIINPEPKLRRILQIWVNNLKVQVVYARLIGSRRISNANFRLDMIPSDYADVLNEDAALNIVFHKTKGAIALRWLEWLLLKGDKGIVKKYVIQYGFPRHSRTGSAIMVRKVGGIWRVPPEFSGTRKDNFITKTVDSLGKYIETMIEDEIVNA